MMHCVALRTSLHPEHVTLFTWITTPPSTSCRPFLSLSSLSLLMGMSQNQVGTVPAEGYVSVITLNPPQVPVERSESSLTAITDTSRTDHNPLLLHPLQTYSHVTGLDDQTLLILSSQSQVQNGMLKNNEPQLLLLDVPAAGQPMLQTASVVQIAPNQQLSLIQTPTLSLMQPSVELLQFPNNTIFLTESEQPLILCLQNTGQQLTLQTQQSLDGQSFVVDDLLQTTDSAMNQVALAKSWHYDADLVNRAMLALNREPSPAAATHLPPLHLPLTSCSSSSHRMSGEKRLLAQA